MLLPSLGHALLLTSRQINICRTLYLGRLNLWGLWRFSLMARLSLLDFRPCGKLKINYQTDKYYMQRYNLQLEFHFYKTRHFIPSKANILIWKYNSAIYGMYLVYVCRGFEKVFFFFFSFMRPNRSISSKLYCRLLNQILLDIFP